MEVDIGKLQANIEKLAKKAGVSDADLQKVLAAAKQEIIKRGTPDDMVEQNTLALVQAKLKRKLSGSANITECKGFFIARGKAFDGSKKPRAEALKYVEDMGDEDAMEAGYLNAKGEILYNDFKWRIGTPIPDEDWQATGVAIIDYNGEVKLANIRLRGDAAIKDYPIFKTCTISVFMKQKHSKMFDVTVSTPPKDIEDEYVDFTKYAKYVLEAYPNRILNSLSELEDYLDSPDASTFGSWCIVEGNVVSMGTTKKGNTAVSIEDLSLDLEGDTSSYTVFFPQGFEVDMMDDAVAATFIVSPYKNSENKITLNGLGYWVTDGDRAMTSSLEETPDVTEPW